MRTLTRTAVAATAAAGVLAAVGSTGIAHAAPSAGAETVQLHYNSAVSQDSSQAIAHGPIAGVGTDVESYSDAGGQAVFTFKDGTVVLDLQFGSETPSLNLTACMMSVATSGTWQIDHGTGSYAGATGGGTYSGTRVIHGTRIKGVCQGPDSGVDPRMVTEDVVASGTASLG